MIWGLLLLAVLLVALVVGVRRVRRQLQDWDYVPQPIEHIGMADVQPDDLVLLEVYDSERCEELYGWTHRGSFDAVHLYYRVVDGTEKANPPAMPSGTFWRFSAYRGVDPDDPIIVSIDPGAGDPTSSSIAVTSHMKTEAGTIWPDPTEDEPT